MWGRILCSTARRRARIRPRRWSQRTVHGPPTLSVTFRGSRAAGRGRAPFPCAHVEAERRDPAHDLSGRPDDDHDAEPHPHGEPCTRERAGRQQHELGVVAGLGDARDAGRDRRRTRSPPGARVSRAGRRSSHETRRASTRGRPRRSSAKPPPDGVDDGRLAPRVRHADHPGAGAADGADARARRSATRVPWPPPPRRRRPGAATSIGPDLRLSWRFRSPHRPISV